MRSEAITLIDVGLSICGTLGGIVVGHILSQSSQRKQWLLDRRNEEFCELLSTLVETFSKYPSYVFGPQTPEMQAEKGQIVTKCSTVLGGRIFIANEVKRMDLLNRWVTAMNKLLASHDLDAWAKTQQNMTEQIVREATKPSKR